MPRFRYEAIDTSGVPIHGTTDVDSESALVSYLTTRSLRLISATELSLESLVGANSQTLPRLQRLRVGEQLREALLTELPAHEAVRAIAAEPLSHPILGVAPWFQVMATLIFAIAGGAYWSLGIFRQGAMISGLFACVAVPLGWMCLVYLYRVRPKEILRSLANRLESGQAIPTELQFAMPGELRHVLSSNIDDGAKARVAADMIPNLVGSNLRGQQFVMTLIGPLVLFGIVLLGIHSAMFLIVPSFTKIFEDFGTDLPWLTEQVVNLSKMAVLLGAPGWLVAATVIFGGIILLAIGLSSGRAGEVIESVPVFGMAFRWAMQARVARILAAMIRNDCDYAESLRVATAGSGFLSVSSDGKLMAKELESQSGIILPSHKLSGLPISMLFVSDPGQNQQERKAAVSDTFQSLSEMLDAATVGQGRLLAVVLQFLTIIFTAFIVAIGVLAMFLPLIKLLNDLS